MEQYLEQYFLPVFLVLWIGISYLLSIMSGWNKLAKKYRINDKPNGKRWRFRSALMAKSVSYGGCLFFTANRQGLGLSILLPFRVGHPPIFIPWQDIDTSVEKKYFRSMTKFNVIDTGVSVYVYKSLGHQIIEEGGIE